MFRNPNYYTTIDLSFLKNKGKESYDVIRRFFLLLKAEENEGRVSKWNIESASLTPSRMHWTARAIGRVLRDAGAVRYSDRIHPTGRPLAA